MRWNFRQSESTSHGPRDESGITTRSCGADRCGSAGAFSPQPAMAKATISIHRMRATYHRCRRPHPEGFVAAPGPTLEEVKEQLATMRGESPDRQPVLDPVREAFHEEATDIVEVEDLEIELDRAPQAAGAPAKTAPQEQLSDSQATPERPGKRVRHRFARPLGEAERAGEQGASRITVLRDRRRGRPKSSDPPG
ncbi:MAG: hypothetical protein K8H88_11960 [Sandaracinaceae bacterium]|nr:hypothetical protein [Sandaracinaceae bacterium]